MCLADSFWNHHFCSLLPNFNKGNTLPVKNKTPKPKKKKIGLKHKEVSLPLCLQFHNIHNLKVNSAFSRINRIISQGQPPSPIIFKIQKDIHSYDFFFLPKVLLFIVIIRWLFVSELLKCCFLQVEWFAYAITWVLGNLPLLFKYWGPKLWWFTLWKNLRTYMFWSCHNPILLSPPILLLCD